MNRASAPMYDLFKAVVAVILAVILILMLLRGCAVNAPAAAPEQTPTGPVSTEPAAAPTQVSLPAEASRTPTAAEPTTTPTAPAPTATTAATKPPIPPTATTAATEPPTAQDTPTAGPETACNTSVPSRLSVGGTALVIRRLNMRSEPSIVAGILRTNSINTRVEIIGGPVCTPVGDRAYLWWQIRLPDGSEGWSAESPLNEAGYFLEPAS